MTDKLPNGWVRTTLGEIARSKRPRIQPDSRSNLPFLGMDSIPPGGLRPSAFGRFGDMKSAATRFEPGDVLYGRLRPYLNKVWHADRAGAASAEFIVFPKSDSVDSDFLKFTLHHSRFVNFASHLVSGDRPRIDAQQIAGFPILLPPRAEQTRIVERIDELFGEIEAGEQELESAREDLVTYRRAILKVAFSGTLTAAWRAENRNGGSSAKLPDRVRVDRGCEGTPKFGESSLYQRPSTWRSSSLGELFAIYGGATPSRREPSYWGGGIPWVSSGEVAFTRITETKETITEIGLQSCSTRLHPPGTVLLAMIGEGRTRGQAAVLKIAACNNQNAAAIRVSETPIPPEYVFYFLRHRYEVTRTLGRGGNQLALNQKIIQSMEIPLPPLDEIIEITRQIEEHLALIQELNEAIEARFEESRRLRETIFSAAFSGRLVPQHAADEPASTLLQRLKHGKSESPTRSILRRTPQERVPI